jgi:hypothetical protein
VGDGERVIKALKPVKVVKGTVVTREDTVEKAQSGFIWIVVHF